MKTLIIQLARLGDIYMSWPVVTALRRTSEPGDEIHMLVRERFREAVDGLDEVIDRTWAFSSAQLLQPLIQPRPDYEMLLERVQEILAPLSAEKFDRVINLSFSPLSSWIAYSISNDIKLGYTRHEDYTLAIPDDASAYFYAQVGVDKPNRLHLTDIFAQVAGVDLMDKDEIVPWANCSVGVLKSRSKTIVLHCGASEAHKVFAVHKWINVIRGLFEALPDYELLLIGSKEDRAWAEPLLSMTSQDGKRMIRDGVGNYSLTELMKVLDQSSLLIGADSAPIHMASRVDLPVLNLSFSTVKFWETGPRSSGSRVLYFDTPEDLPSDLVVTEACSMLRHLQPSENAFSWNLKDKTYQFSSDKQNKWGLTPLTSDLAWNWAKALYMGQEFPIIEGQRLQRALFELREVNGIALQQLAVLRKKPNKSQESTALGLLQRFDEILQVLPKIVPEVTVLISWFETERMRFGPQSQEELIHKMIQIHEKFHQILGLYIESPAEARCL